MTKKKKRRRGQKVEKPEAFMANFFKGLEIYQTKLLVSAPALAPLLTQTSDEWPHSVSLFRSLCFFLFLIPLPFLFSFISGPCVLEEKEKKVTCAKSSAPAPLPSPGCPVLSAEGCRYLFLAGSSCVSCADLADCSPKFRSSWVIWDAKRIWLC